MISMCLYLMVTCLLRRQWVGLLKDLILQVFQLKVDGVAFRLIPELSQIKNAIKVSRIPAQIM